jgi:hypothetical protein
MKSPTAVGQLKVAAGAVSILLATAIGGCGAGKVSTVTQTASAGTAPPAHTAATSQCDPVTATTACAVRRIKLKSSASSSTVGVAEVLKKGNATAIAIVGEGLPRTTSHNAYAVWLYNSPSDALRLGFVNPGVGKNGRLATAGALPPNATHYKKLVVTIETQPAPRTPGPIVLEAPFAE